MSPRAFQHRGFHYSMLGKCRNSKSAEAWRHKFKYTGIYSSSLPHISSPISTAIDITICWWKVFFHDWDSSLHPPGSCLQTRLVAQWSLSEQACALAQCTEKCLWRICFHTGNKTGKIMGELLCLEWCAHLSCACHPRPILCRQRYMSPVCSGKESAMGKFFPV